MRAELARRRRHHRHDGVAQPSARRAVKVIRAEPALRPLRASLRPARQHRRVVPVEAVRVDLVPAAHHADALAVHQRSAAER